MQQNFCKNKITKAGLKIKIVRFDFLIFINVSKINCYDLFSIYLYKCEEKLKILFIILFEITKHFILFANERKRNVSNLIRNII